MRRPAPYSSTQMPATTPKRRCAVYTRKSTDEGLDMEYNSLEAQRDAGLAYIASQRHEGWIAVADGYDDGGFSGGNMDRPALRRLMADIEDGKIDIVVVYKIDRLTRSLPDFARLVEVFDRHGVSFVSVTQQFNTTTSMGRLVAGKDSGVVHFDDGEVRITADLPKKVEWDQALLASLEARIAANGDNPREFIDVSYRVSETKFSAWASALREQFIPARTVKVGKPSFRLALLSE